MRGVGAFGPALHVPTCPGGSRTDDHRVVVKGCPEPRKANVIGSRAEEDCSGAESAMGTGEGGKEEGLTSVIGSARRS